MPLWQTMTAQIQIKSKKSVRTYVGGDLDFGAYMTNDIVKIEDVKQ